jgi:UPF0755 protein
MALERLSRRQPPPRPRPSRTSCIYWLLRLGLLFAVLLICAIVGGVLYFRAQDFEGPTTLIIGGQESTIEPSSELNAAERAYLRGYLTLHAADIEDPVSANPTPIGFVVEPGESAAAVADALESAGLISDATLFRHYLRYYNLDSQLEAGEFTLRKNMTIPEIAQTLSHALADEIELRITEGWRMEQTAAYLAEHPEFGIDPAAFLTLARRSMPAAEGGAAAGAADVLESHAFLSALPPDATLEGYLFPDTYRLPADATAADLVDTMLFTFGQRVTSEMSQAAAARGLDLHGAVTLASIVEREAQLPDERPLVASVFLNRLAQGMSLEADPTVQYALGYQEATGQWWKRPLLFADLEVDSPYNTYRYAGLPPGPIASPGTASIQAVVEPAETAYLFFVVDCTAATPGAHVFAETFEEHAANVARCQ